MEEELAAEQATNPADRAAVLDFVRTPFAVRCNVVKIWRPLPRTLWSQLSLPPDMQLSQRRERYAVLAVAIMVVILAAFFSGIGYRNPAGQNTMIFPVLGNAPVPGRTADATCGWSYAPGLALPAALWVAIPPLVGWAFVRLMWIPMVAADKATREATLAFARHLSGMYLYVYLMIVAGAALMLVLTWVAPAGTLTCRWYLWCFFFGESFFVPAAMWLRLVVNDASGGVFGRFRYALLAIYGVVLVIMPIFAMLAVFR